MFKKIAVSVLSVALLVVGGALVFKEELMGLLTRDMFVAGDADAFSPGIAVGSPFPAVRALHQGTEIASIAPFIMDRGMIFIANRSADW